jgi:hypothetical protein
MYCNHKIPAPGGIYGPQGYSPNGNGGGSNPYGPVALSPPNYGSPPPVPSYSQQPLYSPSQPLYAPPVPQQPLYGNGYPMYMPSSSYVCIPSCNGKMNGYGGNGFGAGPANLSPFGYGIGGAGPGPLGPLGGPAGIGGAGPYGPQGYGGNGGALPYSGAYIQTEPGYGGAGIPPNGGGYGASPIGLGVGGGLGNGFGGPLGGGNGFWGSFWGFHSKF